MWKKKIFGTIKISFGISIDVSLNITFCYRYLCDLKFSGSHNMYIQIGKRVVVKKLRHVRFFVLSFLPKHENRRSLSYDCMNLKIVYSYLDLEYVFILAISKYKIEWMQYFLFSQDLIFLNAQVLFSVRKTKTLYQERKNKKKEIFMNYKIFKNLVT